MLQDDLNLFRDTILGDPTPKEIPSIINLGCGRSKLPDTLNIDISPEVNPDWCHDIREGFPALWGEQIKGIMALNFFVMIDRKDFKKVLNECHRVLGKEDEGILVMLNFDAGKHPELYHQDPCHEMGFTRTTYDYFVKGASHYESFGSVYGFKPWKKISVQEKGQCLMVTLTPIKE